ncbi:MAG: hypothetical protein LBK43_02715 [Treponema sp.]|jgi:hypothetical protein|nr:hypothetical protein [Treponema sp.]
MKKCRVQGRHGQDQDKRIEIPPVPLMWYTLHRERNMAKKSAKIIEIKELRGETGLIIIEHVV